MQIFSSRHPAFRGWPPLLVLATLLAAPALAKPSNFGSISVAPGFKPAARNMVGYAKGVVALHKVVGDRDRNNNRCMGYGSPEPDHILMLNGDFARLKLQVNSGKDTTLLIKGPGNQLYCADDTSQGPDAGLVAQQLKAGAYKVWVGTSEPGQNYRYTLSVAE
jgi:hypothetical protein